MAKRKVAKAPAAETAEAPVAEEPVVEQPVEETKAEGPVVEQTVEQPVIEASEDASKMTYADAEKERCARFHEFDREEEYLHWCCRTPAPPCDLSFTSLLVSLRNYKKALSNLPAHPGYPYVQWPEKPDLSEVTKRLRAGLSIRTY